MPVPHRQDGRGGGTCFWCGRHRPEALAVQTQEQGTRRPLRGVPSLAKGQVCITGLSATLEGFLLHSETGQGNSRDTEGSFLRTHSNDLGHKTLSENVSKMFGQVQ